MTDVLTPEQRRRNMQAIRSSNTRPEMAVRRAAHSLGLRFRLHRKDLPGKPDLVFPRFRAIVFVHGCYWHMHDCRWGQVTPRTNAEFWARKRAGNAQRDSIRIAELRATGWRVLTIWECETTNDEALRRKLKSFFRATASKTEPNH